MSNTDSLNFNRGLIINARGIQFSDFLSYSLNSEPEIIPLKDATFEAALVFSTTTKDTFLLKNHIDDLGYARQIPLINETISLLKNSSINESPANDVYLKIQNLQSILIIDKEMMKPSGELVTKVKDALKHHDPYHELMEVFRMYGHLLPKKVALGHKIYRLTCLTIDENSLMKPSIRKTRWTTRDFSESELYTFLNQWDEYMSTHSSFDLSYLVSIDNGLIMRSNLKDWIKSCLSNPDSLQIISWIELYPLYEIFDLPLRLEIESIIGSSGQPNVKVLMKGTIPIMNSPFRYRFKSMDICGFLVFIEHSFANDEFSFVDSQIAWMLIGIPAKVGYCSTSTRNISVSCSDGIPPEIPKIPEHLPQKSIFTASITLNVPKNLPKDSILVTSFKYPSLNYEPSFIADILSYQDDKIKINVYNPISDDKFFDSEYTSQELKYSIQWHILENLKSSSVDSSETLVHLDAIGQT
ncbi:22482_t:CDS:2, partial [Gigaspora rosea]